MTDAERQNAGVFRVQDMSTLVLCTDEVKRFIETEAFTNIESLEVGETT